MSASILAAAVGLAYASIPNLSGEWKLNPGRSDLGEMASVNPEITLSIRQENGVITIRKSATVMGKQIVKDFRYTLDGRESLNEGVSLQGLKGKASFERDVLVVRSEQEGVTMHVTGEEPPEIEYFKYDSVEEFSLAADGKTLTVVQTGQLPDGPRNTTFLFEQQAADPF
jgi:hypothetical protein